MPCAFRPDLQRSLSEFAADLVLMPRRSRGSRQIARGISSWRSCWSWRRCPPWMSGRLSVLRLGLGSIVRSVQPASRNGALRVIRQACLDRGAGASLPPAGPWREWVVGPPALRARNEGVQPVDRQRFMQAPLSSLGRRLEDAAGAAAPGQQRTPAWRASRVRSHEAAKTLMARTLAAPTVPPCAQRRRTRIRAEPDSAVLNDSHR
jgi:hypothetical protein